MTATHEDEHEHRLPALDADTSPSASRAGLAHSSVALPSLEPWIAMCVFSSVDGTSQLAETSTPYPNNDSRSLRIEVQVEFANAK